MNNAADKLTINLTIFGMDTFRIHLKSSRSLKEELTTYNQCNQVIKSDSKTSLSLEIVGGQVSATEVSVPSGLTVFAIF